MITLAPSILSADFSHLGEDIIKVAEAGAKYIHIDVMDGNFVPNITLGPPVVAKVRACTDAIFDVHLMVQKPENFLESFANSGADILNFHVEADGDPVALIKKIRALGKKAAITIKPKTTVKEIVPLLPLVDMVLVMSVEPGAGGQKFMEESLDKIRELAAIKKEQGYEYDIQVDGGIYIENVRKVLDAGANSIVAGSSVYNAEDVTGRVHEYLEIFKEYGEIL